jgi:putative heme-binding domain-containing protein
MVRLYLASTLQRLPLEQRWDILAPLLGHGEDGADHNLPLMYWYAAEPMAGVDPARAAKLAVSSPLSLIQQFTARRIAALGTPESLALLVGELGRADSSPRRLAVLVGIEDALRGRRQVEMPTTWPDVFKILRADDDANVRSRAVTLGVTFGDPAARDSLRRVLTDSSATIDTRQRALAALLKVKDPPLANVLHELILHPQLGGPAVRALSTYDDPSTPAVLIKAYPSLGSSERRDVLSTLSTRKNTGRDLLAAVEAGKVPRGDLTADLVRQLRNLKDPDLTAQLGRVWGTVRETSGDRARSIAQSKAMLLGSHTQTPDRSMGRAVFSKVCQQCHTLFGVGGQVGPDLTGSNRADLDYLLSNILDPSALIGKDYLANVITTTDGRVLTGIIKAEDKDAITLVTANETIVLPKNEVDERRASEQSMMPEDLLKPLSQFEIRSLVSYLASPAQVPMPTTESSAKSP